MFENLLFQQHIVSSLKHEIENESLPGSLLFYGESYSGKLTCALELARVLNCHKTGEWGCDCKSCKQSLELQHPYTLLTGSRYSMQEIIQSSQLLISEQTSKAQYIFTRNVRKLIKRFSEDLWDKEDNKYKKAVTSLNKIDDVIHLIEPGNELPKEKKLLTVIKKITDECQKLSNELPKGNIPISQVRKISTWVRRSSGENKKVVILERAELMQDSSRNALLKILEEPPSDTYFILISEKKSTVLPTILSRVRSYGFKERNKKEQTLILQNLFKADEQFNSFKDYFFSFIESQDFNYKKIVDNYIAGVVDKNSSFSNAFDVKVDGEDFLRFLELLTNVLKDDYFNGQTKFSLSQLEIINNSIRDIIIKYNHYNQNPMLLLETLFYGMKRLKYA